MRSLLHTFFIGIALLLSASALAQTEFTAAVSATKVGLDERLTVRFSINANSHSFEAPDLSDFRVLGGPNRSQSTRIINGAMNVEHGWSFTLMPRQTGTFTIGPATVISDGETYRSKAVTIEVSKSRPRSSNPNDPYNRAAQSAFIRVLASKTTVYVGEPIVANYKLYFNTDVGNPNLLEEPDFTGFYKEEVDVGRIKTQKEQFDGSTYTTGIIRQLVLIPQRSGTLKPGEVAMQIPTSVPSNRTDFFGRRMAQRVNQTSRKDFPNITVRPLPEQGRPDHFNGAVGRYRLEANYSRNQLNADESLSLKVTLRGEGNIGLVDLKRPEVPSAFEIFDPEVKESIRVSGAGMSGSKTYEYLLVPRYGGTYKIPEIKFSYFDPASQQYRSLSIPEKTITVNGASGPAANKASTPAADQEQVDFINREILTIKQNPGEIRPDNEPFYGSSNFYGLLSVLALGLAGMVTVFVIRSNRNENPNDFKSQRASKAAKKHLSSAKKHLQDEKTDAFYLALSHALWGYFTDKLQIPPSQLNKEEIAQRLRQRNVDEDHIEEIIDTMNRAEMARYAGMQQSNAEEDYQRTASLLTKIDQKL